MARRKLSCGNKADNLSSAWAAKNPSFPLEQVTTEITFLHADDLEYIEYENNDHFNLKYARNSSKLGLCLAQGFSHVFTNETRRGGRGLQLVQSEGRPYAKQRILEKMIGSTAIKGFETGNGFLVSRLETRGTTSKERRSSLSRLVF